MNGTIFEKVCECLNAVLPCGQIEEGDELKKDLGLDSLSLVSVIVGLEDSFNILFDDSDLDPGLLITVKNLVSLVGKHL